MPRVLPAVLLLLVIAGCARDSAAVRGVGQRDAQRLNAQRSPFDTADDPTPTANTRFAAGQLAEAHNAPQRALEQYRQALRLDARHLPSLHRIGIIQAQLRDYPAAIETFRNYLTLSGNSPDGHSNLGYCLELAGRPAEAEAAYRQGIAAESAHGPCRVNLGLLLARHGRHDEALTHLQAVLRPAEAHYNLGSVHESQGRRNEARAAYRKALELDPSFHDARTRMAGVQ